MNSINVCSIKNTCFFRKKKDPMKTYLPKWAWLALLISCILSSRIHSNHLQFFDLQVYYGAVHDLFNKQVESPRFHLKPEPTGKVYDKPYGLGSGYFKYAPITLAFLSPLILIPWKVILYCWPFLYTFLCFFLLWRMSTLLLAESLAKKDQLFFYFFISLVSVNQQLWRELALANLNIVALFFAVYSLCSQNKFLKPLSFSAAVLIKPHFLFILPLMLIHHVLTPPNHPRRFHLSSLFLCLLGGLLAPFLIFQDASSLYIGWYNVMITHNNTSISINTFFSMAKKLFSFSSLPAYLGVLLIYSLWQTHFIKSLYQKYGNQLDWRWIYLIWIALIPNFLNTDTNHFIFSFPLIMWTISQYTFSKKQKFILYPSIFLFSVNLFEILGRELSSYVYSLGLIGGANAIIVLLASSVSLRQEQLKVVSA